MNAPPFLFPNSGDDWLRWLENDAAGLISIFIGLVIFWLLLRFLVSRGVRRVMLRAEAARYDDPARAGRRTSTVIAAANWGITTLVVFIGFALVLDNVGLDVTALVTSAGVAGLGLTFGAQQLVRDLINGSFILGENQYQVGDSVRIAGVSGTVLDVNPRRTLVRDANGHVVTVPNGQIDVATNMTRDFARVNLDVTVGYVEDIARVRGIIDALCEEAVAARPADFITTPKVLRVNELGEAGAILKVWGDVKPFAQWDIQGDLRARIIERFRAEGIEMPPAPPGPRAAPEASEATPAGVSNARRSP